MCGVCVVSFRERERARVDKYNYNKTLSLFVGRCRSGGREENGEGREGGVANQEVNFITTHTHEIFV